MRREGSFSAATRLIPVFPYFSDHEQRNSPGALWQAQQRNQEDSRAPGASCSQLRLGNTACNHSFCASSFTVSWMYKWGTKNGTYLKCEIQWSLTYVHFSSGEGNGTQLQYSCLENPMDGGAWWAAVHRVARSRTRLSDFTFTFHFHALEKEMAIHSSVLAWRIPGMGEPGGLPSMGLHRVGHDWSDLAAAVMVFGEK